MERKVMACIRASAICAVVAMPGCGGPGRSARAYCSTYHRGFDRIKRHYPQLDQYSRSNQKPLLTMLQLGSAYRDIVALMGDMSEVAPNDIKTDVERVHDTMKKQLDDLGDAPSDPLGTITRGLVSGITNGGAFERMDAYTLRHC